jgi:hypothetical protein
VKEILFAFGIYCHSDKAKSLAKTATFPNGGSNVKMARYVPLFSGLDRQKRCRKIPHPFGSRGHFTEIEIIIKIAADSFQ